MTTKYIPSNPKPPTTASPRMFDVSLPWANFWYDAFNVLLFLGAFAVAVGTYGSIKMGAVREKYADERIIANEAETKRAVADSDSAKAGAAKANERVAELSTQAEQLRRDTAEANARALEAQLALEKFKQPRLFSEAQTETVVAKLKQFAGVRFDAAVLPGDPEAIIFLSHIAATLEKAGWIWVEWNPPNGPLAMTYSLPGKPNIGQLGFFGVSLQINPAFASTLSTAANSLGLALIAEGFETTLDVIDNSGIPNKDTVHLIVGKKRQ